MARKPNKPVAGISLTEERLDIAVLDPKTGSIIDGNTIGVQAGTLTNPELLKQALSQLLGGCNTKWKDAYLSAPTDLLRQIEMPKMADKDLFTALSSEAERYQAFQGTEAIADFCRQPARPDSPPGTDRMVFGGVRQDLVTQWLQTFNKLKIKPIGLDIHINQILRAMAGSGVLDAVVQQAGPEALWGAAFRGRSHVWFVLWRGNTLVELREVNMDLGAMATEDDLTKIILENDIEDELRRTAQGHGQVAVWLAEGLSPELMSALSTKLEVPIQPIALGPIVADNVTAPLHPAAIGAAMMPLIPFPFEMNFLLGEGGALMQKASKAAAEEGKKGGKKGKADKSSSNSMGQIAPLAFKAGVASIVFMGIIAALVWGYHEFMVKPQLKTTQTALATKQATQQQLTAERTALQQQYDSRAGQADVIHKVVQQNRLFPAILDDLHTITPTSVWMYSLSLSPNLTLRGKGLSETAVVKFAKQFDPLTYVSQVKVNKISRELVGENAVYDFELAGSTNAAALMPPPPAEKEEATPPMPSPSTPGGDA